MVHIPGSNVANLSNDMSMISMSSLKFFIEFGFSLFLNTFSSFSSYFYLNSYGLIKSKSFKVFPESIIAIFLLRAFLISSK